MAYAILVAVMLLWASGAVVARGVHELVPPIGFSFWRWVMAAVFLTPLAAVRTWRQRVYLSDRWGAVLLLGLFMAGGSTLIVVAVQYTTATNVALVSATQPIVTAVIAWFVLNERLSRRQAIGIAAASAGVVAMIARLDFGVLRHLSFNPGDAVMLASVSFYALYAVNLHRWIAGVGPLVMMYLTSITVAAVLLPFYAAESVWIEPMPAVGPVITATIYMALVPTLLATTMWNMSVGAVGANRATIFTNLLPIFGTALAVAFLDEALHLYHIVGGVLICAGISLVVAGER